MIASGAVDYSMHEAHNQQLSLIKKEHRSLCPRIEIADRRLAQHYDFNAVMRRYDAVIHVDACLSDEHNRRIGEEGKCQLEYSADDESFSIKGSAADAIKNKTEYVLPVICASAVVDVTKGTLEETKPVFNLNPGFMGTEYRIKFDDDGLFELKIRKRSAK